MGSSTPTPWARGNPSLGAVVKSQNRDSAQQRRETVNITKPNVFSSDGGDLIIPGRREMPGNAGKVLTVNADEDAYELAAVASGGGTIQQALAAPTTSVSGAGGALDVSAWTFYAGSDGTTLALTPPAGWWSPLSFGVPTDGWYEANISITLGWTPGTEPASIRVFAGRATQGYTSAQFKYQVPTLSGDAPGVHSSGTKGAAVTLVVPKQYYVAADHCFSTQITWPNTATPTSATGSGSPAFSVAFTRCG